MTDRLHPISMLLFFLFTIILPAITGNPLFFLVSLINGLIVIFNVLPAKQILKSLPWYLLLFILISCFNPLFYHDGDTVLFYLNNKRITMEALAYGINSATMVIGVLIWCRLFSHFCTDDKIMFIFGTFSPKTAVIISMVMRLVPMYREHIRVYRNTQRLLGIYGEGTLIERIRGEFKIFGGFLTRLLEHSMTTSDSMTSRGYGVKKRKSFNIFSFKSADAILICLVLISAGYIIYCIATQTFATSFYPEIMLPKLNVKCIFSYIIFTAIALCPTAGDCIYKIKIQRTKKI